MIFFRRERHQKNSLESKKAQQINDRCRELSAEAINRAHSILNNFKDISKKYESCTHLDVKLVFYLNENHRLFHPDTDNILSWCDTTLFYKDLKKNKPDIWVDNEISDWNDSPFYREFEHCYIFHDLVQHRNVRMDDLMQINFVSMEFNLEFENKYDFKFPFSEES